MKNFGNNFNALFVVLAQMCKRNENLATAL